jgi:glutaminyl-peptide cyclotransferase
MAHPAGGFRRATFGRFAFRLGVAALLVVLGCFPMSRPSTNSAEPPTRDSDFAIDRNGASPVPFDARRAMGYLDDVCAIGPRISGSEGMQKQQELLTKHFEKLGGKVELQKFTARQNSQKQPVEMANLIVSWFPERERRVILCSHYDTRPIADQEPDMRKWREPFLSANDGGSGVALLMELGHHMKDLKTNVGVDFVFFDGEEYVFEPRSDKYFFGSENFGRVYRKDKKCKYLAAVLMDMIGGKTPHFPVEQNSWFQAGDLVQQLWSIAGELKCTAFEGIGNDSPRVEDDHVALFRNGGIPAIDIIDFSYPHWHRLSDLPENCAGAGLEQVARVLSVWIQRVK